MNQWLYILRPTRLGMVTDEPSPEEAETVSRHFAYLSDLTDKGVMILVGRTQNADETPVVDLRNYRAKREVGT